MDLDSSRKWTSGADRNGCRPAKRHRTSPRVAFAALATAVTAMLASPSAAIVVSDDIFVNNGGDPADVAGTIARAMLPMHNDSYREPFLAVGRLEIADEACTATWIGDSRDRRRLYLLTSLNCSVRGWQSGLPDDDVTITFVDWQGRTIGSKTAPKQRFMRNEKARRALERVRPVDEDLVVLSLHKHGDILDLDGNPLRPPVLYDGHSEVGHRVWFVGYGAWGTGSMPPAEHAPPPGSRFEPGKGARRAVGSSVVALTFVDEAKSLIAPFISRVGGAFGARGARADAGAAWWQKHDGRWTIVATMSDARPDYSAGPRVSHNVRKIRQAYPDALFLSDLYTVTELNWVRTHNFALDTAQGTVAYVVPPQNFALGPTKLIREDTADSPSTSTPIDVLLVNTRDGRYARVHLRAWRLVGCGNLFVPMNNAIGCYHNRSGPLLVAYDANDNRHLAPGRYQGSFDVEARGWDDTTFVRRITLHANIIAP